MKTFITTLMIANGFSLGYAIVEHNWWGITLNSCVIVLLGLNLLTEARRT